jgi:hypothetical protein
MGRFEYAGREGGRRRFYSGFKRGIRCVQIKTEIVKISQSGDGVIN